MEGAVICDTERNACLDTYGSGTYTHNSMLTGWNLQLLSSPEQWYQYIGLLPDPGIDYITDCWVFSQYARQYTISRRRCLGTWSVTRGSINLIAGECNDTLPDEYQYPITRNPMYFGVWYTQALVELLGPFATSRNQSSWQEPSFATAIAGMVWSRIVALSSATKLMINGQNLVGLDRYPG